MAEQQEAREHRTVKHMVDALAELCAGDANMVVDLLTGYLWNEEEASCIKSANESNRGA